MRQSFGRVGVRRGGLFAAVPAWAGIVMVGAGLAASSAMAAAAWAPDKSVELVVPSGTGGGNDKTVRVMQQLIQQNKLVSVPISVLNKPGGGQAVTYAYLRQHAGDGHVLASATMNMLTNRIMGTNPLSYRDLTPVVQLTRYYLTFVVRADSPIQSFKDVEARLRADPQSLAFGISSGAFPAVTTAMVGVAIGIEPKRLKRVVFRSGGEIMTALLGGHVDLVAGASASVLPHHRSGKIRIIGVTAPQRLPGAFAEVPTIKEQGVNVVSANWYNLVGPPGLSADQVGYWEGVFEKVTATEEWKQEIERNVWQDSFLKGRDLLRGLQEQEQQLYEVLNAMGQAKQKP
jgi:putative tricarboxylic transport membrane protein